MSTSDSKLLLITGATGKVGRAVVTRLLAEPAFAHHGDDPVHAISEPLDVAEIGEHLHQRRVARKTFVSEGGDGHGTGQAARTVDF